MDNKNDKVVPSVPEQNNNPVESPAPTPNVPTPSATAEPTAPKMVTISEDHLNKILGSLDSLQKDYKHIENKLAATVDRQKLDAFNQKSAKKVLPTCRISLFEGMVVIGWTNMIANKAEIIFGKEITDQRTYLLLRKPLGDGKYEMIKKEVDYVTSFQARTKEEVDILSKTVESDGQIFYKLLRADGEEIIIDERFIN